VDVVVLIMIGLVCLAMVIGIAVAAGAAARHRDLNRQAGLQQWATRHGWAFVTRPAVDWGRRLPGRNGDGVALSLAGTQGGRRVSVAEYSHTETGVGSAPDGNGGTTTTTTTNTRHYVVTVVHLDRPSAVLGVQPRSAVSKLGRALFNTGSEIGHADFDKQFTVVGDPAAAAYRISPALIAAHLDGVVPSWSLSGTDLLSWRAGRIDTPDRIPELAAPLVRVADLLT
jgi:hypothetical protein